MKVRRKSGGMLSDVTCRFDRLAFPLMWAAFQDVASAVSAFKSPKDERRPMGRIAHRWVKIPHRRCRRAKSRPNVQASTRTAWHTRCLLTRHHDQAS